MLEYVLKRPRNVGQSFLFDGEKAENLDFRLIFASDCLSYILLLLIIQKRSVFEQNVVDILDVERIELQLLFNT